MPATLLLTRTGPLRQAHAVLQLPPSPDTMHLPGPGTRTAPSAAKGPQRANKTAVERTRVGADETIAQARRNRRRPERPDRSRVGPPPLQRWELPRSNEGRPQSGSPSQHCNPYRNPYCERQRRRRFANLSSRPSRSEAAQAAIWNHVRARPAVATDFAGCAQTIRAPSAERQRNHTIR